MWVEQVSDEGLAEFLHTYEQALGIGGKGSETSPPQELIESDKNARPILREAR